MARTLKATLVDYLVIAISPALVMTLVGSLVFFLILVFYQGSFSGRLQTIFALFVFAAVLIGRISIEHGRERAMAFALPLGIVTLVALNRFVQFQGSVLAPWSFFFNAGLIGLIWWSADKLTWDCTVIDESQEDSGEGLLEAVGLEHAQKSALQEEIAPSSPEPEATTSREDRSLGWWEKFVERRRRPHAPGVWVVYFSLAAVALFGIGQLFIPGANLAARQYALQLLCVYTASGLGLLLTTSFLGLRRYLRQRRQEMPLSIASLWLVLGAAVIVGVMSATMLLPRPNPEYAISELPFRIGSPDQTSSPYGAGHEAVREEQPWSRGTPSDAETSAEIPSDRPGSAPPKDATRKSEGDPTSGKQDGDNSRAQPDHQGESDRESSASKESKRVTSPPSDQAAERTTADRVNAATKEASHEDRRPRRDQVREAEDAPPTTLSRPPLHKLTSPVTAAFFKWLFYGAVVVIAAYSLWTHRRQFGAALRDCWHGLLDLLHNLFGGTIGPTDTKQVDQVQIRAPLRRFADFTDPFATGVAATWPSEQLVRYTFEALEAWAAEHGWPRRPEQTPHEFARSVAANVSSLADDVRGLADLYCQAAYASGTLASTNMDRLSRLWQNLAVRDDSLPMAARTPGEAASRPQGT